MERGDSRGHPALTDESTGLPNRLHFDTVFGVVFAAGDRGIPVALILVEISDYDSWMSELEPAALTSALADLGILIQSTTRKTDLVARTAEDRFALVLLDCNLAGARLVADRLDVALEEFRRAQRFHTSMGAAVYARTMESPEDLVAAASSALQAAREAGGNSMEFQGS